MFRIESKVDTKSPDYRRNFEEMGRVVAEYRARLDGPGRGPGEEPGAPQVPR